MCTIFKGDLNALPGNKSKNSLALHIGLQKKSWQTDFQIMFLFLSLFVPIQLSSIRLFCFPRLSGKPSSLYLSHLYFCFSVCMCLSPPSFSPSYSFQKIMGAHTNSISYFPFIISWLSKVYLCLHIFSLSSCKLSSIFIRSLSSVRLNFCVLSHFVFFLVGFFLAFLFVFELGLFHFFSSSFKCFCWYNIWSRVF